MRESWNKEFYTKKSLAQSKLSNERQDPDKVHLRNCSATSSQIAEAIASILTQRQQLFEMSLKSRDAVKKVHDSKKNVPESV